MQKIDLSKFKRDTTNKGRRLYYVLAKAKYIGCTTVQTKTGNRNFYYLAVLFCRKDKQGKPCKPRCRVLAMSGKDKSEFNRFLKTIYGQTITVDVISDQVGPIIESYINENTLNVNAELDSQSQVPVIMSIYLLPEVYIKKEPWMDWPPYLVKKYPTLKEVSAPATVSINTNEYKTITAQTPTVTTTDLVKDMLKQRREQFGLIMPGIIKETENVIEDIWPEKNEEEEEVA